MVFENNVNRRREKSCYLYRNWQVWFQNRRSKERRMKQLNVLGARRQFYRSGVSATRRLRELMPAATADSLRPSADFIATHQHNFAFYSPGTIYHVQFILSVM